MLFLQPRILEEPMKYLCPKEINRTNKTKHLMGPKALDNLRSNEAEGWKISAAQIYINI